MNNENDKGVGTRRNEKPISRCEIKRDKKSGTEVREARKEALNNSYNNKAATVAVGGMCCSSHYIYIYIYGDVHASLPSVSSTSSFPLLSVV